MHRSKSGKYRMANPTTVTQYAENEEAQIPWESDYLHFLTTPGLSSVTTVRPLHHIARAPKYDIIDVTWELQLTAFNFTNLPTTISNIQLTVNMGRAGRITDDIIQLCYLGELIGENQARPAFDINQKSLLQEVTVYSGDLSTWKIPDLTLGMVQDPTFGIVLRYKGHPAWPHKVAPVMQMVDLQIS